MKDARNRKQVFTARINYRVRDEWLVPKIVEKLGPGKRTDQLLTWTRKVSDIRKFAREMANLQAELNVKLIWKQIA